MSLHERIGEFGTLMALGTRRGHVFRLIITESALLGLVGGLTGAALGVFLAWAISAVGIPMPPLPNAEIGYTARIQITLLLIVSGFAVGCVATTVAALLPAARVSRTPVVEALRSNI
jgi:putative ABC transport system permease protein